MAYCFSCEKPPGFVDSEPKALVSDLTQKDCENGIFCSEPECPVHSLVVSSPSYWRSDEKQYDQIQKMVESLPEGGREEVVFECVCHSGPSGVKYPRLFFADGCSLELYAGPTGNICFEHGATRSIRTGVRVKKWPPNCVGIISNVPRVAAEGVLAASTVLDSGFKGEIVVILSNLRRNKAPVTINSDQPVALLTLVRSVVPLKKVDDMPGTVEKSTQTEQVVRFTASFEDAQESPEPLDLSGSGGPVTSTPIDLECHEEVR